MHHIDRIYIDGAFVTPHGEELYELHNPATTGVIGRVRLADAEDARRAIAAAKRAFPAWSRTGPAERIAALRRMHQAIAARAEELTAAVIEEYGAPVSRASWMAAHAADVLAQMAEVLEQYPFHRRAGSAEVVMQPLGVAALITPWNSNAGFICGKLAAALAAGCTAVVKPSEMSALQTRIVCEALHQAGLPPGVFNIVLGLGASTGKALAEHRDINKLVLTGGTEAGRIAGSAAAKVFAHQTMELGGKTPVMVFDDFDVERAVNYAAFGAFIGAGQTCVCGSRHLVQASIYDEFVERLAAKTAAIRLGDPFDPATQLGPVISERQRERVLAYAGYGRDAGARAVAGGRAARVPGFEGGYYVEPTVFADVTADMRIFQEEVFGPFTSVTRFEDEADALRLANDSPFGLAAAVRTRDVARAHRVAHAVKAGIVWINDHHRLDPASPWGGVGDSGLGRECGIESFNDHFDVKSVMVATGDGPFDWYRDTAGQRRLN